MRLCNALWVALLAVITIWGPASAQTKSLSKDKSADTPPDNRQPAPSSTAMAPVSGSKSADKKTSSVEKKAIGKDTGKKSDDQDKQVSSDGKNVSAATSGGVAAEARPVGASGTKAEPGPGAETRSAAPADRTPTDAKRESTPAADTAQVDGSTYVVRMRDLAQRIDELKEQIRRSHTRLSLLSETILSGGVGGARAEISFSNEMSTAFRLTRALFVLDGAVQYNKQDDTGALAEQKTIPIFSGSIPPGDHTLQVLIRLQGYGYGVFSYLRGYKFEVKSTHSFTVAEGRALRVEAIAWEKGGVTTPLEQRPAIRYVQKIGVNGSGVLPSGAPTNNSVGAKGSFSLGVGGE